MSKICPFRHEGTVYLEDEDTILGRPCIEEQCQLWDEYIHQCGLKEYRPVFHYGPDSDEKE